MPEAAKTVGFVLKSSTDYLAKKGIENARTVGELLLGRLLNCPRLSVYLEHERELAENQLEAMRRGLKRAADGEPVQYILGQWEFMGRAFKVDRRALIPRPETEELVKRVLDCQALWAQPAAPVADVGTGSGCIAISLAAERPQAAIVALDTSADALALARENAQRLGVAERIGFLGTELCEAVEPESLAAIVANLPYIPTADYERLPRHIRDFEPRAALDGGSDGLAIIGPTIQDAAMALRPGGFLFLEIDHRQGERAKSLMEAQGFGDVSVLADAAGRDRIVEGRLAAV